MSQNFPFQIEAYGISDVGLVRTNNEDVWGELKEEHFYVIADGMGGHKAGEVAAQEAVDALLSIVRAELESNQALSPSLLDMKRIITSSIQRVNAIIYSIGSAHTGLKGMGTTLCCLYVHPKGVILAHVGDSRIYRFRRKKIALLTRDHSLVHELIDQGQMSEWEAKEFPQKNVITKSIGLQVYVEPTISVSNIGMNDMFMMCTDGLSDMLTEDEMCEVLNDEKDVKLAVQKLVSLAKERGGTDNITVVLVNIKK